jgi:hypothetical protein
MRPAAKSSAISNLAGSARSAARTVRRLCKQQAAGFTGRAFFKSEFLEMCVRQIVNTEKAFQDRFLATLIACAAKGNSSTAWDIIECIPDVMRGLAEQREAQHEN